MPIELAVVVHLPSVLFFSFFPLLSENTYPPLQCPSAQSLELIICLSLFLNRLEILKCAQNATHIWQKPGICPIQACLHPESKNFAPVFSLPKGSCIDFTHDNCLSSCLFSLSHWLGGLALACVMNWMFVSFPKTIPILIPWTLNVIVFGGGVFGK